jgi:zona occludens toxin
MSTLRNLWNDDCRVASDTHKARPPWKVIVTGAVALLLCIAGITTAVYMLRHMNDKTVEKAPQVAQAEAGTAANQGTFTPVQVGAGGWTEERIKPRLDGMPWTAPIYDQLTTPTDFPRVAACVFAKRTGCQCYTQQATKLQIPESACLVYVKEGSFDPWLSGRRSAMQAENTPSQEKGNLDTPDELRHEARRGNEVTVCQVRQNLRRP